MSGTGRDQALCHLRRSDRCQLVSQTFADGADVFVGQRLEVGDHALLSAAARTNEDEVLAETIESIFQQKPRPSPADTIAITALMPMTMPRLVSTERPLWTNRAPRATRIADRKLMVRLSGK